MLERLPRDVLVHRILPLLVCLPSDVSGTLQTADSRYGKTLSEEIIEIERQLGGQWDENVRPTTRHIRLAHCISARRVAALAAVSRHLYETVTKTSETWTRLVAARIADFLFERREDALAAVKPYAQPLFADVQFRWALVEAFADLSGYRGRRAFDDDDSWRVWYGLDLALLVAFVGPIADGRTSVQPADVPAVVMDDPSVGDAMIYMLAALGDVHALSDAVAVGADAARLQRVALLPAAEWGHLAVVELILALPGLDMSHGAEDQRNALTMAAYGGHVDIVRRLLKDGRLDPSLMNSLAFLAAAEVGSVEMMQMLINDGRVDIAAQDGVALHLAAGEGHIDAVAFLVDKLPFAIPNSLIGPIQNGHEDVVACLLAHGPIFEWTAQPALSVAHGHSPNMAIARMIAAAGADFAVADNLPVFFAARAESPEILNFILAQNGVDPSGNETTTPLAQAVEHDRLENVRILLADDRVDAHCNDGQALKLAEELGRTEIAALLRLH